MDGQHENLLWSEAKAQKIIQEEIVQLIGSYEVFGLLRNVSLLVGWSQFG